MRRVALCFALLLAAPSVRAQTVGERLTTCQSCHGAAGAALVDGAPYLGGQPSDYLLVQLVLFRDKQRVVDVMNAQAEGLSDDDLRTLADEMAKLPPPTPLQVQLDAAVIDHGRDLAARYRCGSCHTANFGGQDQIPRLAGQREDYLVKSLTEYKSNARAGYDPAMNEVSQEVKAEDIPVLAKYLAAFH